MYSAVRRNEETPQMGVFQQPVKTLKQEDKNVARYGMVIDIAKCNGC